MINLSLSLSLSLTLICYSNNAYGNEILVNFSLILMKNVKEANYFILGWTLLSDFALIQAVWDEIHQG